jgi:preprotein translocase subunit YajC
MNNMTRYITVFIILIVAIVGGFYLFSSSQKEKSNSQQTGGHGTTAGGHKSVTQGQRTYEPEITSDTANIKPNQSTKFSYKIKNDRGEILKKYEIVHEKIMHFIVVRKDLQNFQHLHPDFNQVTGEFSVNITFPTDGYYRVFPDFTPTEDNPQNLPVTVYQDINVGDISRYKVEQVIPDSQPKKTVGEYQITYNFPAEIMMRNEINYTLTIEMNGQPITNLENYLGALGHSVILKEGTLDFIHAHADETIANRGPEIKFSASFPEEGIYKIFTQFQHQNKVITTDYVIRVN